MKKSTVAFEDRSVRSTEDGTGTIRVGIGGWSYAPWRQTFYPADVPQTRALEYASRQFSAIEINSTFYGSQKPATFAKWHEQTPDGFMFSVKALRGTTHRSNLDDAAAAIDRFVGSGLDQLGAKLGPLLWQFPPSRKFDAEVFDLFLGRLPPALGRRPLRHVLDVRHASFACAEFVAVAREHRASIAYTDAVDAPQIADISGDCVYLRLREAQAARVTGYTPAALKRWVTAARQWSAGNVPESLNAMAATNARTPRDVFVYFINGAKERAPAAARHFSEQLLKKD